MKSLTNALALLVLAIGGVNANAADSGPSNARYGVAKISNPLSMPVTYQYRWGKGAWKTVTVGAYKAMRHSWRYQFDGQNASPTLQVRFDSDPGAGTYMRTYTVKRYAVRYRTIGGKNYRFKTTSIGRLIWLSALN